MDNHQKNFSWISSFPKTVYITDVGPRDGLQNESKTKIIPAQIKVELIKKLRQSGLKKIECGSFVSPKWVCMYVCIICIHICNLNHIINIQRYLKWQTVVKCLIF